MSPTIPGKSHRSAAPFSTAPTIVDAHNSVARPVINVREPLERIEAVADLIEQCAHQTEPTQVPSR